MRQEPAGSEQAVAVQLRDPSSIYQERLNNRRRLLKALLHRVWIAGYVRGVTGMLIPATLWVAFALHLFSSWFALIPAAAFLAAHKWYEEGHRKLSRAKRAVEFYERG